jgi:hypothetical protein
MGRSLKIKWASSNYRLHVDDGIRVRIYVDCASGLDTRIFAYRMLPISAGGARAGFFSHICSPVDMTEWPADEPRAEESPEWFRLSFVDVFVRSIDEAENFIAIVRQDVRRLILTLAKMDTTIPRGEELLGEDCSPPDDSSVSSEGSTPAPESLGALQSFVAVGTSEQSVGNGVSWRSVGIGAGSPIGSSDSAGANRSRVTLQPGESSKLLLVQGFDFHSLPDDIVIEGIESRVILRDATNDPAGSIGSGSSEGAPEPTTCPRISLLVLQHPDLGNSDNRVDDEPISGSDWETLTIGGEGDRWGFSSIPASYLKDGAFGLGIVVHASATEGASVEVDGVELEPFYKEVLS